MTPRDRVIAALNHETTDRAPFQATFTPEFANRLRKHFGLAPCGTEPHHREWYGYELELLTGQDALQAGAGWFTNYYLDDKPYVDNWGVQWKIDPYNTPFGSGIYTNIKRGPLADDEPDVDHYQAPDPNAPGLYSHVERLVRDYKDEFYIIGRVHCTIFESAWALRGFENLLMDFYINPDLAGKLLDITFGYHLEVAKNMARIGVDMIWLGDDFGSQNGLLLNPDTWNEFFRPRYEQLCKEVKQINKDIKIAFHSDGCVYDIIPGLIDAGIDVLNPIQTECMNPQILKDRYGDRLAFFGGMAVQSTLPMGSPADIRREYEWLKATLGKNGGWLCAPTHHVQQDTPVENFLELIKINKTINL
jgi:uroporphyrinogen decarboxylase